MEFILKLNISSIILMNIDVPEYVWALLEDSTEYRYITIFVFSMEFFNVKNENLFFFPNMLPRKE